jgi:hypothetical protein
VTFDGALEGHANGSAEGTADWVSVGAEDIEGWRRTR